jgi:hypothetical protein
MNLLFAILIAVIVGSLAAWLAVKSLREGVVRTRFDDCYRDEHPIVFWIMVGLYGTGVAMSLGIVALNLRDLLGLG